MTRGARLALCAALMCCMAAARAEPYAFALIGDLPYNDYEREALPRMLESIAARGAAFVIHAGDFKSGSTACSDALYDDRLRMLRAAPLPLVFVPGDNEWLDCWRRRAGGFDPLERLQRLRRLFYPDGSTLGRAAFTVERQSADAAFADYREHMRWIRGPVMFLTLNVTGSDNGWDREPGRMAEFVRRAEAVRAWLDAAFAMVRREGLRAIVIVIQGNPGFEAANAGHPRRGYRDFLAALGAHTRHTEAQVVLVHGDTHFHRIDRPMLDPTRAEVRNFLRVETYGSPFMGWVHVQVDEADPALLRFESHPYPGTQDALAPP